MDVLRMKKLVLAVAMSVACTSVMANTKNTYDYVDLAYTSVDMKEVDLTFTGVGIDASKLVTDNVYVSGSWFSVENILSQVQFTI